MRSMSLQHVSIWLEDGAAGETKLAHGLEWAFRLELPLRVTAIANTNVSGRLKTLGETAAQRGVTSEVHLTQRNHRAVDQFLRADGLCVVPGSSMTAIAQDLAAPMSRMPNICQLLCSSAVTPIERILVLCRDVDLKEHYIESAAKICHTLDTTPVILILAGSEYDAELKREYAEGVFHSRRMAADVDMVVDRDPIKAVERVASWRRCSHVIMPGNTECLEHVARDMSRSASVLTIPRSAVLEMPRKIGRAGIVPSTRVTFNQPVAASEHI